MTYVPQQPVPPEPFLVSFGDIGVTSNWVVTPSGRVPVRQAQFLFTDLSHTTSTIPAWAIVLAIVFFLFCLLGLLFLLVKEERTGGWVQIVVTGPGLAHTTQLPVSSPQQVMHYAAQVNYARAIAASAS
ncbi:MAG: hypothetical protein AB7J32_22230 [Pseudonocardia sp.]